MPLTKVEKKVLIGKRLTPEDAVTCFESDDIFTLGRLANHVAQKLNGNNAYFVQNHHINPTNICVNRCKFCAFSKSKGDKGAYELSINKIISKLRKQVTQTSGAERFSEVHIVGGLHPDWGLDHYVEILEKIKKHFPSLHIKAFTAVEIDYFSKISSLSLKGTLIELKNAGLESMPGGGAEIFSSRVRNKICPEKINGKRWLKVMETAHSIGLKTNATMLYGHLENHKHRVEHMLKLRELQDTTGGFQAFIPLAFHSKNTNIEGAQYTSGLDDLKTVAISRLFLDNFPHIKAYWVMLGEKIAQLALMFGADDLDGTIIEEKITKSAGALSGSAMTKSELVNLIEKAGKVPVERDLLSGINEMTSGKKHNKTAEARITKKEGLDLLQNADLLGLGMMADGMRKALHPDGNVSFIIDRNINYTNVCMNKCKFCAFYRNKDDADAYVLSKRKLFNKIRETIKHEGTQILMQGGLHPDLGLDYYVDLLKSIKAKFPIHIHGFSPPEITYISETAGLSIRDTLLTLQEAGLDSIPGGGAEILSDKVRKKVSPKKIMSRQWLKVMEEAHKVEMRTTATMMFGSVEGPEDIIEHLDAIRRLQDKTDGFTAFIPWSFQPGNTELHKQSEEKVFHSATAVEYLRVLALSRVYLDNIPNIQASWVTQGLKMAQVALRFGANDFGSTMLEENVVAAAGVKYIAAVNDIIQAVNGAGFKPVQRDMYYNIINDKF